MWIVFSKEFLDIIRNRRRFIGMIVSSFILFPLLFVGPYAFLLGRLTRQSTNVLVVPVSGAEHAPALITYLSEEQGIETVKSDNVEELIRSKQYSVGLIIPADYEELIAAGETAQVTIVADLRRSVDVTGSRLGLALRDYGDLLVEARLKERGLNADLVKPLVVEQKNAATAEETAGSLIGLVIPGFIISLGLSSGMPVAVSSIAGEKKKQTLEPVLFTTVSRFQLVFAKLMAVLASVLVNLIMLTISVTISAVIMVVVIVRALPSELPAVLAGADSSSGSSSSVSELLSGGYSIQPLAILLFLLAPALIVILGAALQLLISTWARNDEEAYTLLTPLSFLSGLVVLVAFFLDEYTPQLWHYALPVFGTIISMRDLLSNHIDPASLIVMFASSTLYAFLMLGLAVWMFHREEVVFRT
jgi:sodium transport system permease protein